MRLPLAPVRQVLRITIADAAGGSVTVQASQYRLDSSLDRARLVLSSPLPTPGVSVSGISIDVTVGYGEVAALAHARGLAGYVDIVGRLLAATFGEGEAARPPTPQVM